ncbi:MAG: ATP-dependent Clp protease proteolytic subunit [Desulfobacterales bacterium]|jgi:ClpP class serine protease
MENKTSLFHRVANLTRSIFWVFLIFIIIFQWVGAASLEKRRIKVIESIQNERGTRVITLIHRQETVSLLGFPVTKYIDIDDAEAALRAIRLTPSDRGIDLILHTPGGLVMAASQIARALKNHKGKVTVFVPHYAMSGGTLLALAADEIVMDPNAVLGPVDPQIGQFPAASIIRAVDIKTPEKSEDQTLILADISTKAINQLGSMVADLLEKRLPREKAEALSALLCTGQFTHDFPITVELAKSFGLPITADMPGSIYSLMDLYPQAGVGRPSVNYVPLRKSTPGSGSFHKGVKS